MIHQRLSHFERVRHARSVDLRIDVADEISLEIEVLNERQRIVGPRHRCVTVEYFTCAVTAELGTKTVGEKPRAHVVAEYRHAVEIRVDRLAAECLECRFGTQITRRPIRFWINASQPSEHRTADAK